MADHALIEDKLHRLFEQGRQLTYKRENVILMPADSTDSVFFIEQGFVKVYWLTEDGNEKLHVIYKPGELFPLMWALNDEPVGGYYVAMDEVVIRRISKLDLVNFMQANPDAVFPVIERLSNIFRIYVNQVDNLVITRSYPRLISRLLFLATRFGKKVDNGILIDVPITHTDIANSIALTRETVNRGIQMLEKKGLIGSVNRRILVFDKEKLETELEDNYEKYQPLAD